MDFEGRPANGSVLKPGEAPTTWELKYPASSIGMPRIWIYNIDGHERETFRATIPHLSDDQRVASCTIRPVSAVVRLRDSR